MKRCSSCQEEKELGCFSPRRRNNKIYPRSSCKSCESKKQVERNKQKFQTCQDFREKSLARLKKWGEENKDKRLQADADRRRTKYKEDLTYRSKCLQHTSERRANSLRATPPWLTNQQREQIANIYRVAVKVSESTGKDHDVDHIIPLKGKNVCGLHVPWNLAILPASLNRSKGNAYPFVGTPA